MTDQHPITPPPELVEEWCSQLFGCEDKPEIAAYELSRWAAHWGSDQELEAICGWLELHYPHVYTSRLRRCRRPKPPSLKEQALAVIDNLSVCDHLSPQHESILRRALESLPASENH